MRRILLIGLLLVGFAGWPDAGSVRAAQPQSGRVGEQSVAARDFERAIYSALTRQYGRPHHRVSVRILFPKKPLTVQTGKLHLEVKKLAGGARTGRRAFRVGLFIKWTISQDHQCCGRGEGPSHCDHTSAMDQAQGSCCGRRCHGHDG